MSKANGELSHPAKKKRLKTTAPDFTQPQAAWNVALAADWKRDARARGTTQRF
jgi:hypothetical protein